MCNKINKEFETWYDAKYPEHVKIYNKTDLLECFTAGQEDRDKEAEKKEQNCSNCIKRYACRYIQSMNGMGCINWK